MRSINTCLLAILLLASAPVRASEVASAVVGGDLASLEQEQIHSEVERVGELPWWVMNEQAYFASIGGGGGRSLADMTDQVMDERQSLQGVTELSYEKDGHRRRTLSNVEGFCLPPERRIVQSLSTCRTRTQRCASDAPCCAGLICKLGSDGRRCRTTCKGDGKECSASTNNCCSKQCVLCKTGCKGRCGLGIEKPRDFVQVRRRSKEVAKDAYQELSSNGQHTHLYVFRRSTTPGIRTLPRTESTGTGPLTPARQVVSIRPRTRIYRPTTIPPLEPTALRRTPR